MSESLKNIKYFEEQSKVHRDAMKLGYDLIKDNNWESVANGQVISDVVEDFNKWLDEKLEKENRN